MLSIGSEPDEAVSLITIQGPSGTAQVGGDGVKGDNYDLDYRLLGFSVNSGRDFEGDLIKGIRSVAGIIDTSNCELATGSHNPAEFTPYEVLLVDGLSPP